jgi:class 3 adenylate cyclase
MSYCFLVSRMLGDEVERQRGTGMTLPQVERRLAAILIADVVGCSRLVEADEAGTLAAMKHLRHSLLEPLLAEHHGRIVKLMGDGLIAEFASVVDAVACAAAVQMQLAEQRTNEFRMPAYLAHRCQRRGCRGRGRRSPG